MQLKLPHAFASVSRRLALASAAVAVGLGTSLAASAQSTWKPNAPVKLVVPYSAGGAADLLARIVAQGMGERLGQPVLVENRTGATGTIGTGHVYSAPADGTTLLVGVPDPLTIYPNMAKTPYDPKKFIPVAAIGTSPFVLLARPGMAANGVQDLIGLARKQTMNFGNAGMGGSVHLMTVALGLAGGVQQMAHVPYPGQAPAIQAVMGDHVDTYFSSVIGTPQYLSKVKFLGVSSAKRIPALPSVPTLTEQGVNLVQELWFGVLAPPNTPPLVVAEINRVISETVSTPAYKAKAAELAVDVPAMTQPEFARYYEQDYGKWSEIIRAGKVQLN